SDRLHPRRNLSSRLGAAHRHASSSVRNRAAAIPAAGSAGPRPLTDGESPHSPCSVFQVVLLDVDLAALVIWLRLLVAPRRGSWRTNGRSDAEGCATEHERDQ